MTLVFAFLFLYVNIGGFGPFPWCRNRTMETVKNPVFISLYYYKKPLELLLTVCVIREYYIHLGNLDILKKNKMLQEQLT